MHWIVLWSTVALLATLSGCGGEPRAEAVPNPGPSSMAGAAQLQPTESRTRPVPSPPPPQPGFGDGTHLVGDDLKAGTYRSTGRGLCYWARLRDFSGELQDIIGNGNNSPEIVTVGENDAAFEGRGCGRWIPVEDTFPPEPETAFGDGTFVVGKHIEPGVYKADGQGMCYWARLSNFSHDAIKGIVTNGTNPGIIRIKPRDKGFTAFGCGDWQKLQ